MSGSASKSPALGRVGRLGMANGTHKTTATMVAVTTKLYRGGKDYWTMVWRYRHRDLG